MLPARARRSQSALEYMMTYGWAILIIVLVAAILYSFGFFSPSAFVPNTVVGFSGLGTVSAECFSDGILSMSVGDGTGYVINISAIQVFNQNGTQTAYRPDKIISPDNNAEFSFPNLCPVTVGITYSFRLVVNYTETDSSFPNAIYEAVGYLRGTTAATSSSFNDSNHTFVFVAAEGGSVSVINTNTESIVANVPVQNSPFSVAVSPKGGVAYVTESGSASPGEITVINTTTDTVTGHITVGNNPFGVAFSPDGQKAYVSDGGAHEVSVISTSTQSTIVNISVCNDPYGLAVSPDGKTVYVACLTSSPAVVAVINTTSDTVITYITIGSGSLQAIGVAVSPDGEKVFVTDYAGKYVAVINASSNTVITDIPLGASPVGITIDPIGMFAYAMISNHTAKINTQTYAVQNISVGLGTRPEDGTFGSNGYLYISLYAANSEEIIDTSTGEIIGNIAVGVNPYGTSAGPSESV